MIRLNGKYEARIEAQRGVARIVKSNKFLECTSEADRADLFVISSEQAEVLATQNDGLQFEAAVKAVERAKLELRTAKHIKCSRRG